MCVPLAVSLSRSCLLVPSYLSRLFVTQYQAACYTFWWAGVSCACVLSMVSCSGFGLPMHARLLRLFVTNVTPFPLLQRDAIVTPFPTIASLCKESTRQPELTGKADTVTKRAGSSTRKKSQPCQGSTRQVNFTSLHDTFASTVMRVESTGARVVRRFCTQLMPSI